MNTINLIGKNKISKICNILKEAKQEDVAHKLKNKVFYNKEDLTVFLNLNGAALKVSDWNRIFKILEI